MTFDPLEQKDGGVTRDRYGRRILVAVDKHAAPSLTDVQGAGTVFDSEGREQVVLQSGDTGGNLVDAPATLADPFTREQISPAEGGIVQWHRSLGDVSYTTIKSLAAGAT